MSHSAMDFRVGGTFHYCQSLSDGNGLWGLWRFQEIQPTEKIVLMQHFSDPNGAVCRNPWNAFWPLHTLSTTTFTEQEIGTLLSIEWEPYAANADEHSAFLAGHSSMQPGWNSVLDRLERYLPTLQVP